MTIKKHIALIHKTFALNELMRFSQNYMIQSFRKLRDIQVKNEVWPHSLSDDELQQVAGDMTKRIRTMFAHVVRAHTNIHRPRWLTKALATHLD